MQLERAMAQGSPTYLSYIQRHSEDEQHKAISNPRTHVNANTITDCHSSGICSEINPYGHTSDSNTLHSRIFTYDYSNHLPEYKVNSNTSLVTPPNFSLSTTPHTNRNPGGKLCRSKAHPNGIATLRSDSHHHH